MEGPVFEHVSVSVNNGSLPTWEEMDYVKNLFWKENEVVVQFHVSDDRKIDYKNVLHMWKQKDSEYLLPPRITV